MTRTACWGIDESLLLRPIASLPTNASVIRGGPEQRIDTILQRNLSEMLRFLFGRSGRFLFLSGEVWGAFDLGCILDDGRLVMFENKGRSPSTKDLKKLCRDIETIETRGIDFVEDRFRHALTYRHDYPTMTKRMFAGFFLGVRSDVQKGSRDLVAEACALLSTSKSEFDRRFEAGKGWLDDVLRSATLAEYVADIANGTDWSSPIPVLLAPRVSMPLIRDLSERESPSRIRRVVIATYTLFSEMQKFPEYLSVECDRLPS